MAGSAEVVESGKASAGSHDLWEQFVGGQGEKGPLCVEAPHSTALGLDGKEVML